MSAPRSIAIIGAGPAGLVLALSLLKLGLRCKVYEGRSSNVASSAAHAALSLQPNGLRVLDKIDILSPLHARGFSMGPMYIRDLATDSTMTEGEDIEHNYGYQRLRTYRSVLNQQLEAAVAEHGLEVHYGRKFSHVVSESASGVTFAFADGSQDTADLLLGADGIHSRVRQSIAPSVKPTYTGLVGLGAEVPRDALRFPSHAEGEKLPLMIKRDKTVLMLVPQDSDGSRIFVGRGKVMKDRSPEEWKALEADEDTLRDFYNEGIDETWPDLAHSAVEKIDVKKGYLWPVSVMPRLDSWTSEGKRIAFLGDAGHAVSPITGQGVNQAFEDAYMLATALAKAPKGVSDEEILTFWESQRMQRVHEMVDRLMGKGPQKEAPVEVKSRLAAQTGDGDARGDAWLYNVDIDQLVDDWAKSAA